MNWNLTINGSPQTGGNNLVAAIYDPSNPSSYPLSPVQYIAITGPFPGTFNITFTGVNPIVYHFVLWETSGVTPGGTARNDFSLQPTLQTMQVRTPLYLTVGSSVGLNNGSTTYTDSSLNGWSFEVEKVAYGTYFPGSDYNSTATSFTLLNGETFITGGKWVLHFEPIISNQPILATTATLISAFQIVTGNLTLTNADIGKCFGIQGASQALTITLPAVSTVSDNSVIWFSSAGGVHINAIIAAAGSDTINYQLFMNQVTASTEFILGQSEQLLLVKANGCWNVLQADPGYRLTGEMIFNYSKQELNTIFMQGQTLSRTTYARLWAWVQQLESAAIVTDSAWTSTTSIIDGVTYYTNKGKFSFGDGSTTFRVPLIYAPGYVRMVDGVTRNAGSLQMCAMLDHQHDTLLGAYPAQPNGKGLRTTVGAYNGIISAASDLTGRAGAIIGGNFTILTRVDTEVRTDNIGVYGLI